MMLDQPSISIGGGSHKGPRDRNEDRFLLWCSQSFPGTGVIAVADGMGGHLRGDLAATIAMQTLEDYLVQLETVAGMEAWLEKVFGEAHHRIVAEGENSSSRGMGTTLTVAIAQRDSVIIGHVGDSRAYEAYEDDALQITSDHTVGADALRRGIIEPERLSEIPHHGALLQSLGGEVPPQIEFQCLPMHLQTLGSRRFLVCSDGIWGALSRKALGVLASTPGRPNGDDGLTRLSDRIVQAALRNGATDNVTVAVMDLSSRSGAT